MKNLYCSRNLRKITTLMIISMVFLPLSLLATPATNGAGQSFETANQRDENKEKIYIIADKLISGGNTHSFEFIGNVKATQGDSVITADRLKVFYKKNRENDKGIPTGTQSIQKIIATGHVVITFEGRVATAEQAVYTSATKMLVLSGPDAKITRGSDTISGETITLYRTDERIKVERGKEKRVEAVFHAGDQGIK